MQSDLVTIEVVEEIPDTLRRVALLNAALFRVLSGVRLIRVVDADYEVGVLRLLVESRDSRPSVKGRVCVRYEPATATRRRQLLRAAALH